MSADCFLDTNVLIYAASDDARRTPIARAIIAEGGIISVQVANEFASVSRSKLRRSWKEIGDALDAFVIVLAMPRPISYATHLSARLMTQNEGFQLYDALIVASALEAGCRVLVTEDLQDGQVIRGQLTVRNPFKAPA